MAADLNVVQKSGSWYTYGPERLGQGRDAAKQFLKENPALSQEIDHKVRVAVGLVQDDDAPVGEPLGMGAASEDLAR
jgi:recombination protein RecA